MNCKECKYGELTKDIFTGGFFYLCTNECEIPFGGFGDTEIPSSKTVIDCPFGEKREHSRTLSLKVNVSLPQPIKENKE